jgi:hypothetical protein
MSRLFDDVHVLIDRGWEISLFRANRHQVTARAKRMQKGPRVSALNPTMYDIESSHELAADLALRQVVRQVMVKYAD